MIFYFLPDVFFLKQLLFNYSRDFPFLRDEINLPVRYGSGVKLAADLIHKAATDTLGDYAQISKKDWADMVNKYLIEDAVVEPTIALTLTDNWMEFNLRYVVDYKKRRSTKNLLFNTIREAIGKTDGKVQLASATFEVVEWPEVKLKNKS